MRLNGKTMKKAGRRLKKVPKMKCENIRKYLDSRLAYATTGGIIGAILFLLFYGFPTLDPTNVSFVYGSTDADFLSHQLGFDFFRNSNWHHPIGLMDNYPYPYLSSVINSDSIPVIAIPLKLISFFSPNCFQYFGAWIFFCFVSQGGAAALILKKLKVDYFCTMVAVPFFICNVPLLFRCFQHSSLAAHWLILFSFLIFFEQEKMSTCKKVIFWCILCGGSVWIHGYLFIIIGFLMTMFCIYQVVKSHDLKGGATIFFSCVVVSVVCYYEGGGFVSRPATMQVGVGSFSFDLTDFVNPSKYSAFFDSVVNYTSETSAYLGLLLLCLLIQCFDIVPKTMHGGAKETVDFFQTIGQRYMRMLFRRMLNT